MISGYESKLFQPIMVSRGIHSLSVNPPFAVIVQYLCYSVVCVCVCVCVCAIIGRVWSLQHSCRITIRRSLGVSRRRRLKELPLPPHLIVFLSSLPVGRSDDLHDNWERRRSTKAESVRKRGEARRRGGGGGGGRGRGIHHIRNSFPHT